MQQRGEARLALVGRHLVEQGHELVGVGRVPGGAGRLGGVAVGQGVDQGQRTLLPRRAAGGRHGAAGVVEPAEIAQRRGRAGLAGEAGLIALEAKPGFERIHDGTRAGAGEILVAHVVIGGHGRQAGDASLQHGVAQAAIGGDVEPGRLLHQRLPGGTVP